MSWTECHEPRCGDPENPSITHLIAGKERDLGAFAVRRVLPSVARRTVGPFIFFDHFGPTALPPGQGLDVRPHPHINLATVTYLFEGAIVHRDSLGTHQVIRPGAINWMTAGRGIVHSERTGSEQRASGARLHGLQLWVALPVEHEDVEPEFAHYPADAIPALERSGASLRVLAGEAFGVTSPVATLSTLFYVDARMPRDTGLDLEAAYPERALYVASGAVSACDTRIGVGQMAVFAPGCDVHLRALEDTHVVFLGGEPVDGPRHIWWNYVSSSRDKLEQAKADWAKGPGATERFPKVPGDEDEFIPLPE